MSDRPFNGGFPSTRWSLVAQASAADASLRREAIESLVTLYWPALRAHLIIRHRLTAEGADDLLQGFVADRILQKHFLGHAHPEKGLFRSFLLRCLENYLVDGWRRSTTTVSLSDEQEKGLAATNLEPPDVFDIAWAKQVLAEAIRRVRYDCEQQGRMQVWSVFEGRVLRPVLNDVPPTSYTQLVAELGFQSSEQAANALVTAKRRFRRALENVVAEYVGDENDIQDEITQLRAVLASAGPLNLQLPPGASSIAAEMNSARGSSPGERDRIRIDLIVEPDDLHPSSLARLFDVAAHADGAREVADLEAMLRHVLSSRRLPTCCQGWPLRKSERLILAASGATEPVTLAALFSSMDPPLDLLSAVKHGARRATRGDNGSLPKDIASLVYFAAIAAALVRCGQRISKLDPDLLCQGAQMMLDRPWIGEPFRPLFEEVVVRSEH